MNQAGLLRFTHNTLVKTPRPQINKQLTQFNWETHGVSRITHSSELLEDD